ncbi:MAG: hypothetical protein U9Q70_04620 [Chloroflexota bacterium]|nr:hypothetical protein [Chloroflexota bacterium]
MRKKWYLLGLGLLVMGSLLFRGLTSCGGQCHSGAPRREPGCDEFTVRSKVVYKNGAIQPATGWYPLEDGDELTTDSRGEAQLNLSACYPGQLFIFHDSQGAFKVSSCGKTDFEGANICLLAGVYYVNNCASEDVIWSGSARIEKEGTIFVITYLPERELTLVIVLDGKVTVQPVESYYPTTLGAETTFSAEEFYFTMPRAEYARVAGLEPRQVYPISELESLSFELGIDSWMRNIRDQAEKDEMLPSSWPKFSEEIEFEVPTEEPAVEEMVPPEMGIDSYRVTSGGGPLESSRIQEAIYRAVDWGRAFDAPDAVAVSIGDAVVAALDVGYAPDAALEALEAEGYDNLEWVWILYPAGDARLAAAVKMIADDLDSLIGEIELMEVSEADINETMEIIIASGEPVIALTH